MGLSCSCDGDYEWWHVPDKDYSRLNTKHCRKCCSCKERIPVGALSLKMWCYKHPEYGSIKEKIYGEDGEVELPPKYLCERCADLYFSLDELGYCITLGDDMRELVKEHAEIQRERKAARALGEGR